MFVPFGGTQTWQPYRNTEKDLLLSFAIETKNSYSRASTR